MNISLQQKINRTKTLIMDWYAQFDGKVYVSFSGGKDSTVLLHIARSLYPDIEAVFCNTGLEFPEIVNFVKTVKNVTTIRPKMNFKNVIDNYGWPIVSKEQSSYIYEYRNSKSERLRNYRMNGHQKHGGFKISERWKYLIDAPFKISSACCDVMKKRPFLKYEKNTGGKAIIGTMASESKLRLQKYRSGECNSFKLKRPISKPLSFWDENDIWEYVKASNLKYSKIYDMGYQRTGCIFCLFGHHLDCKRGIDRVDMLKNTHPKLYDYCIEKLNMKEVLKWYPPKKLARKI